jgi:hypothetical protein
MYVCMYVCIYECVHVVHVYVYMYVCNVLYEKTLALCACVLPRGCAIAFTRVFIICKYIEYGQCAYLYIYTLLYSQHYDSPITRVLLHHHQFLYITIYFNVWSLVLSCIRWADIEFQSPFVHYLLWRLLFFSQSGHYPDQLTNAPCFECSRLFRFLNLPLSSLWTQTPRRQFYFLFPLFILRLIHTSLPRKYFRQDNSFVLLFLY